MSLQLRIGLVTIGFVLICFSNVSAARGQQKLLTPEQRHIVDTVSSMFTALRTDDTPKFDSVIAPGGRLVRHAPGVSIFGKPGEHIMTTNLVLSSLWLRVFALGSLEWLWCSLTYWKRQPLFLREIPA